LMRVASGLAGLTEIFLMVKRGDQNKKRDDGGSI
jgi:hypothetical protein